jgi:hypothetical protein
MLFFKKPSIDSGEKQSTRLAASVLTYMKGHIELGEVEPLGLYYGCSPRLLPQSETLKNRSKRVFAAMALGQVDPDSMVEFEEVMTDMALQVLDCLANGVNSTLSLPQLFRPFSDEYLGRQDGSVDHRSHLYRPLDHYH